MDTTSSLNEPYASAEAVDHVGDARKRAQHIFGDEAHVSAVDDWRRAFVSARDSLVLVWVAWVALEGFGSPPFTPWLLITLATARALLVGMSMARSTVTQVQYYAEELERERAEIRDDPEREREEVRALYAAKGFREPLLSQIVDTLAADDDRLLKVMMEEELGLSLQHINHPLLVGVWNGGPALLSGLALALPLCWFSPSNAALWANLGGIALLAFLSFLASLFARRRIREFFFVSLIIAIIAGGAVHFLSQWLTLFVRTNTSPGIG